MKTRGKKLGPSISRFCYHCDLIKDHSLTGSCCRDCKKEYDLEYKKNNKETLNQKGILYRKKNKKKLANKNKLKRRSNKDKYRIQNRVNFFKITEEELLNLIHTQNNLCAICNKPETAMNSVRGEVKNLSIDHDHESNKIRGLLCQRCNTGIGMMNDDINLLYRAIEYLKKHKEIKEEIHHVDYYSIH